MTTILVADKDNRTRNLIRLMFTEHMGYKVVTTSSGSEAVLKAKAIKPDIILADISLFDKNGYTISREIKDDPLLKHVIVLLLIHPSETLSHQKNKQAYADAVIRKPFEPAEVINTVQSLTSKRGLRFSMYRNTERQYRLKLYMKSKKSEVFKEPQYQQILATIKETP
ncbi:MAG TPA: response regulator [Thermodesulfobacteriota bacterium]|nr:response regulator [Thermodesulfobacteriota bacterium]